MKFFCLFLLLNSFVFAGTPVVMETSMGTIEIELDEEKAPVTVENFLMYADLNFYSFTLFHRTVKKFVIQGGGLTEDMQEKETLDPIKNEATNGLSNLEGTISMARETAPDTATSQIFINVVNNVRLDHQPTNPARYGYAVFGIVTSGLEIVHNIENVATTSIGEYDDVPVEPVIILSVSRKAFPTN